MKLYFWWYLKTMVLGTLLLMLTVFAGTMMVTVIGGLIL